ncbi:hypothetical protein THAOC_00147, partial [Thalassiosira oceanica]
LGLHNKDQYKRSQTNYVHHHSEDRPTNRHYSDKFYRHAENICSSPVQGPAEIRLLESSVVQARGNMAVRRCSTNSSMSGKDEDKPAPRLDSAQQTTPETMLFGLLRIDLPKSVRRSDTAYRRSLL